MISGQASRYQFKRKIGGFTFLKEYLGPSLTLRVKAHHWYDNRVLRYVLKGSPWLQDLETTLQQADLGSSPLGPLASICDSDASSSLRRVLWAS